MIARFKKPFFKIFASCLFVVFLHEVFLIYYGPDTPADSDHLYWMADLNTLYCRRMSINLYEWMTLLKKTGNSCKSFSYGTRKYALLCDSGRYVVGYDRLECIEAGMKWKNLKFEKM